MNITKNIINDLIPLYLANECSPDTRALVDDYLRSHPEQAADLRRIMSTGMPRTAPVVPATGEVQALKETRRRLRRRSWLMGVAIFFSLAPFSFVVANSQNWWMLRDAPRCAAVYAVVGVTFWGLYALERHRSRSL